MRKMSAEDGERILEKKMFCPVCLCQQYGFRIEHCGQKWVTWADLSLRDRDEILFAKDEE